MTRVRIDPDLLADIRRDIEAMQQIIAVEPAGSGLVPLRLTCAMTSCQHGRHCLDYLRRPRPGEPQPEAGCCRDCGELVVPLPVPGGRAYGDDGEIRLTCTSQQSELMRAHYWQVPIDRWAYNQALKYGRQGLLRRVRKQIRTAMDPNNGFAGRGASYERNIVAYAQHATATCCRRCAAYWHGTPGTNTKAELSKSQMEHLVKMASAYFELRLPELPEFPTTGIASIRIRHLFRPGESERIDETVYQDLIAGRDPVGIVTPIGTSIHVDSARTGLLISRHTESLLDA